MIKGRHIKALVRESGPNFKNDLRALLGIKVKGRNIAGGDALELCESRWNPEEFSIANLADELLGQEFTDGLTNAKLSAGNMQELREAIPAQGASSLQDINAFSATVGGLLERKMMEGYGQVTPISQHLFRMDNGVTVQEGQKYYCLTNLAGPLRPTHEGLELPNVAPQPRWVWRPPTTKYGGQVSCTREAMIAADGTGLALQNASSLGYSVAYWEEYWCSVVFQGINVPAGKELNGFADGIDGRTYQYKTADNTAAPGAHGTYQTAAQTGANIQYNYVNQATQTIVDFTSIQAIGAKLALMTEFETGRRIPFERVEQIVVAPAKRMNAEVIAHATQVLPFSPGTSTSAVLGGGTYAKNPVNGLEVLSSSIYNKSLVDSGISQANADVYATAGSGRKAFVKAVMWPFSSQMVNPLAYGMVTSEIAFCMAGSVRMVPFVEEPRYVFQCTN